MQNTFDLLFGSPLGVSAIIGVVALLGLRLHSVKYSDPNRNFEANFGKPHSTGKLEKNKLDKNPPTVGPE
jgi:hypothetical protein